MKQQVKKVDTYSYKGWLNSDSFLKRAFATYGYVMVASLIIMLPLYAIIFLVMIIFMFLSMLVGINI